MQAGSSPCCYEVVVRAIRESGWLSHPGLSVRRVDPVIEKSKRKNKKKRIKAREKTRKIREKKRKATWRIDHIPVASCIRMLNVFFHLLGRRVRGTIDLARGQS